MRALLFIFLLCFQSLGFAQSWPNHPVRIIVPFSAGGNTDSIARITAEELTKTFGQTFIVENKPGANGAIAANFVAKAPADGYTLLMMSNTQTVNESLIQNKPFNLLKDFVGVAPINYSDLILVVHPSLPVQNLKELITLAKSKPDVLNFASSGNGTPYHMAGELFTAATSVAMIHAPYRGSGPAVADLVGGQVQVMFDGAPSLLPYINTGKIRALAAASPRRNPLLPNTPTFAELGFPSVNVALWYGLMAPAGTPPEIIARLNREVNQALKSSEILERFASQGTEALGGTPEQAASYVRQELDRWGPVVKKAGIAHN
jgi:tripartite-type tricarboxylate transporter receptor subunit TctC